MPANYLLYATNGATIAKKSDIKAIIVPVIHFPLNRFGLFIPLEKSIEWTARTPNYIQEKGDRTINRIMTRFPLHRNKRVLALKIHFCSFFLCNP